MQTATAAFSSLTQAQLTQAKQTQDITQALGQLTAAFGTQTQAIRDQTRAQSEASAAALAYRKEQDALREALRQQ